MKTILSLLVITVFVAFVGCYKPRTLKNCGRFRCPAYKVLERRVFYEKREYYNMTIAYSEVDNRTDRAAYYEAAIRLFQYANGTNKNHSLVWVGRPIGAEINFLAKRANLFFYIPDKNPPEPTNKNVTLMVAKNLQVYVRSFYGHARSRRHWIREYYILKNAIKNPKAYYHNVMIAAFYGKYRPSSPLFADDYEAMEPDNEHYRGEHAYHKWHRDGQRKFYPDGRRYHKWHREPYHHQRWYKERNEIWFFAK